MFEAFSNTSSDKYPWISAEEAEGIFLKDFKLKREMIALKELLLLLERQTVHLLSPKNDITTSNINIFPT